MTPRRGWLAVIAAGVLLEAITLRRQVTHGINDTASACTRDTWRTHTRPGRLIFRACLYGGAIAFERHITKETR